MSVDETNSELDDKVNEIVQKAETVVAEARAKLEELLNDLRAAVENFQQSRTEAVPPGEQPNPGTTA